MYGNKYGGVPTMGGNINPDQPPGYRPGNTLRAVSQFKQDSNMPSVVQDISKTDIMRENFENQVNQVRIQWQ